MLSVNHPSAVPDESFVFTAQSSERSRTYVKKHCLNNIAAFADIPSWVPRTQRCSSALVVLQQGTQQSRAAWNLSAAAQLLCCFFCPNQLWRQKIHPSRLKVFFYSLKAKFMREDGRMDVFSPFKSGCFLRIGSQAICTSEMMTELCWAFYRRTVLLFQRKRVFPDLLNWPRSRS